MAASHGLVQIAQSAGVQGFCVFMLWRMARRAHPFLEAIREADPVRETGAGSLSEDGQNGDAPDAAQF